MRSWFITLESISFNPLLFLHFCLVQCAFFYFLLRNEEEKAFCFMFDTKTNHYFVLFFLFCFHFCENFDEFSSDFVFMCFVSSNRVRTYAQIVRWGENKNEIKWSINESLRLFVSSKIEWKWRNFSVFLFFIVRFCVLFMLKIKLTQQYQLIFIKITNYTNWAQEEIFFHKIEHLIIFCERKNGG